MRAGQALFKAVFSLLLLAVPAQAAPFAGVNTARWIVQFDHYTDPTFTSFSALPDGVTISCFNASAFGSQGCISSASLVITNGSASLSQSGGFTVTNASDIDLLGFLIFRTDFSAFNPGGSPIGAQVDDPSYQYAAFSSSVFGPGVGDFHSCDTRISPNMGPKACGVFSPDSSQGLFSVGPLLSGETLTRTYNINIAATIFVPEPVTLSLFGFGLAGAAALRRRRKAS